MATALRSRTGACSRRQFPALSTSRRVIDQERRRERELLQGQIDDLQLALRNANEHQTRLTALLTDQLQERDRKEAQEHAVIIKELRRRQIRLEHELRERDRGFSARWLGIGAKKKDSTPRGAAIYE